MKKTAVLTSLFGSHDDLKSLRNGYNDIDYYAFVDRDHPSTKGWTIINSPKFSDDPHYPNRRNSKPYKLTPHLFVPGYDYYIWIDAVNYLTVHPDELIDNYLVDTDMAVFKHPYRQCAYQESEVCTHLKIDNLTYLQNQFNHYQSSGFPKDYGLYEMSCFILRNNESTRKMGMMWAEQVSRYSSRDQISFPYVLWRMDKELDISIIPGYIYHKDGNKFCSFLDLEKYNSLYNLEKKY